MPFCGDADDSFHALSFALANSNSRFDEKKGERYLETKQVELPNHTTDREQPTPITNFNPDVPYDLQRIVRRCLAKDPEERYQTIKDVAIEIKEVRRELQGRAGIDTTVPPATIGSTIHEPVDAAHISTAPISLSPTASSRHPSSAEYIFSEIKRHKTVASTIVALLALLLAGTGLAGDKWSTSRECVPLRSYHNAVRGSVDRTESIKRRAVRSVDEAVAQ